MESKVDIGSTFTIYLPATRKCQKPETQDALSGRGPVQHEKRTGTILVVDDESFILETNRSMLRELGYEVLLAEGGEDAIRLFTENRDRIDLLILDLIMPDIAGEVVYDRVKSLRPDIRVILSSGYSVDGQAEKMLRKGCDGFLQKPYNMAQLGEKISEALK